jgi:hypothetical protein
MDDALDARDVRLERRLRIGLRLVLYPLALGLIALAWQYSHSDPPVADAKPVVQWSGVTSQGRSILGTSSGGRLRSLDTTLVQGCSNHSAFTVRWYPGPQRFQQHGEVVRGHQAGPGSTASGGPIRFDGWVRARMGTDPQGTIVTLVRWTPKRGTVVCNSGSVTFTLHRSPAGRG